MAACPEHEDLFEYVLAGLDADQRESVKKHLGACRGCQDQIAHFALVTEGLALKAPPLEAPAGIEDAVKKRIRAEPSALAANPIKGWAMFWMRLGPVFAVMSLIMTGVAFAYMQSAAQARAKVAAVDALSQGGLQTLMASGQVKTVNLKGVGGKACSGSIICASDSKMLFVSFNKLRRCPVGRVYTVWTEDSQGAPAKLATFVPEDGEHPQAVLVEMERSMKHYTGNTFKVTLQDKEAPRPSGELVLASGSL